MYTTHGHLIAGTTVVPYDRPAQVARCGGPGLCDQCSQDALQARRKASRPLIESLTYDENTLVKVYAALARVGIEKDTAMSDSTTAVEVVQELLNAGILFRERI